MDAKITVSSCTATRTYTHTHTQKLVYAATVLTEFTWTCTIEPHVTLARHDLVNVVNDHVDARYKHEDYFFVV